MRVLVTGGCGFIGSALIRHLLRESDHAVLNVDALTYAATLTSLAAFENHPRYRLAKADICDAAAMRDVFAVFHPDVVVHLAAETHVDRSIDGPGRFVQTNVVGTSVLLDAALAHWRGLTGSRQERFRFHHVSTDEVFGQLGAEGRFSEASPYDPRSPYSASKAAADHLVSAWRHTYGLPTLLTNCSNNYGPYQFPEKLIPLMIIKARGGEGLPVYGRGENVRDWLHVDDHARALRRVFEAAPAGAVYTLGGGSERRNIDVVRAVCAVLDELDPRPDGRAYAEQIAFVDDRPGHDHRYAIDAGKIARELGWEPSTRFEAGLAETVRWYLDNPFWWQEILARRYGGERLGLGG